VIVTQIHCGSELIAQKLKGLHDAQPWGGEGESRRGDQQQSSH
jgi:hypothetical protein